MNISVSSMSKTDNNNLRIEGQLTWWPFFQTDPASVTADVLPSAQDSSSSAACGTTTYVGWGVRDFLINVWVPSEMYGVHPIRLDGHPSGDSMVLGSQETSFDFGPSSQSSS